MAINFPASPTTNQTYTFNGRTWTYNGVGWQATGSTGLTVYTKTNFTATAGQTSFSCTYTVGFVDVYYNGSKLSTSEYTATTGSTVVLGTACAVGDIVETIAWTISSSFNPSLGSASATSLAIGGATIGTNALAVTGTTALSGLLTAAGGVSSTLTTDATSATTGSIITAGGISTQKALWVGTTSQHVGAATFNARITQSLSPVAAEYALRSTGQTTGWIAIDMANTGGDYIIAGENSTGNNIIAGDSAYDMCVRGPSGIAFSANAGASQQMRLDSSGNLLVGKTTTGSTGNGAQLLASGFIGSTLAGSTSATDTLDVYSTAASAFRFYVDMAGTIHATSTSITAISDRTLKTNIRPLDTGLKEIMGLQPRRFDWINGDGENIAGFVAQEVEEVLPELVTSSKYSVDENGDNITKKAVKMGDMIPHLVAAIQELTTRLAALENK